ncbi:TPA: hypothetical protein DDZ86_00965 [Candidatus Dependentiae bacterium]|nr:hypothetical protein [Candidatus Dependentiae bacterium]
MRMFFVKCVGIFTAFGCSNYAFSVYEMTPQEAFYKAVESADVEMVQKMIEIDPLLKTSLYKGNPMIWGVLQATRLKNKVVQPALKKYAKIIKLLGKSAACLKIKKVDSEPFLPLDYSLRRCYSQIDKALIKFEQKPSSYVTKTAEEFVLQNKVADKLVEELEFFLVNKIIAMDVSLRNSKFETTAEADFITNLKDVKGRALSGKFTGNISVEGGIEQFSLSLYTSTIFLAKIEVEVNWQVGENMDVLVSALKVSKEERQNGFGGMMLDAVIKAICQLEKSAKLELYAAPSDVDKCDENLFFSRLVSFYKKHKFVPNKWDANDLKLTIEEGKVLPAYKIEK